ncbi:MAG TPA: general stress protein [Micromonosporaceae bacterium]|nr:general stress protein [Micromonosporaceae bacterium]
MTTPSTDGGAVSMPGSAVSGAGVPASGLPGSAAGPQVPDPARPTVTVATYPDYASAQRAVDYLSDNQFPVEHAMIVGTDLRLVEKVLGRLTIVRAAMAGAASGAWFGFFIGLLFALFSLASWWSILLVAVVIGAIWGAVFGAIAHAITGGRRDFTSKSTLVAGQYAVTVDAEHAEPARQLVTRLNWRESESRR